MREAHRIKETDAVHLGSQNEIRSLMRHLLKTFVAANVTNLRDGSNNVFFEDPSFPREQFDAKGDPLSVSAGSSNRSPHIRARRRQ